MQRINEPEIPAPADISSVLSKSKVQGKPHKWGRNSESERTSPAGKQRPLDTVGKLHP